MMVNHNNIYLNRIIVITIVKLKTLKYTTICYICVKTQVLFIFYNIYRSKYDFFNTYELLYYCSEAETCRISLKCMKY